MQNTNWPKVQSSFQRSCCRKGLQPPTYSLRPPAVAELKIAELESCDPPPICSTNVANSRDVVDCLDDKPFKGGRLFVMRGDPEITEWDMQVE